MSVLIRKFVPHFKLHRLSILQFSSFKLQNPNHYSFTVKYLINKCGFSSDKALLACKNVNFDKKDSCLAFIIFNRCISFLQKHGFTNAHLFKLLKTWPSVVTWDPEKTLLPIIQFLRSKGFEEPEIPALIMVEPDVIFRTLEDDLVPAFNLLKDRLGVEGTVKAIRRCPMILSHFHSRVRNNIKVLKEAGVPDRGIAFVLSTEPARFALSCDQFKGLVEDVVKTGIDPRSWQFVSAVCSMGALGALTWKKKLKVYRRWGCSEVEVLTAFKKVPRCMKVSVEKIDGVMDFFVNQMGWTPQMVLLKPKLFTFSLQKRIVPRCSVYKLLLSKGLLKVEGSLYTVVTESEDNFLEKFINCYPEEAPELLRHFDEKTKNSNEQI